MKLINVLILSSLAISPALQFAKKKFDWNRAGNTAAAAWNAWNTPGEEGALELGKNYYTSRPRR